jgi:hypothetical protein
MTTALAIPERRTLHVVQAGTNHGARGNLPHLRRLHEESDVINVEIIGVDPLPNRARAYAADADRLGLRTTSREAKIEEFIDELPEGAPVLLNMDNPAAHAAALRQFADRDVAVLGGFFAASPADGQLFGFRYACSAQEHEPKREVAQFCEHLAAFAGRGGRDRVWGERGRPEHLPLEPVYRQWEGSFVQDTLDKLAIGVPSNYHYLELTRDGRTTLPIIPRSGAEHDLSPFALATEVLGNPPVAILRGDGFVVAELRPDGVRFHFARLGKTDGRVRVNGYAGFDRETLDATERAERERQLAHEQSLQRADLARQEREVTEALRRAEQQTVTRRRPFFFTD